MDLIQKFIEINNKQKQYYGISDRWLLSINNSDKWPRSIHKVNIQILTRGIKPDKQQRDITSYVKLFKKIKRGYNHT